MADLRALGNSLRAMLLRGVVRRVDDTKDAQTIQATVRDDEDFDGEAFQGFGLSAVPPVGTEVVVAQIAGSVDVGIVIASESREHRPTGGAAGDVVLYDAHGHQIRLVSSGIQLGEGASLGVARTTDAVTSVPADDGAFWTWVGAVSGYINGLVPGTVVPPVSLTSKVTGGSGTVKAVD